MINKKSFFILIFLVMLLNLAVICASNTEDTISKEKLDRSSQISQNTFENDHTKTNDNENTLFNKNKTYANAEISKSEQNSLKAGAGEENVNSYAGLVTAVNNAKTSTQENYTINLQSGNYDATEVIRWNSTGNCKTLIINGNNNILNGKGTIQFMQINSGTTVILNNIHLNNYYRNGNGGVIVNQGTLIIRNSSLTNSQAIMAGGAIYNSEANLIIENSTLTNNYATMGGGAIYNYKGNINIAGSKINGNYMNDPTYGGGAIYNRGTLTISNSSFTKNVIRYDANALGGAIYNYRNSILNITNTNFTSNEANEGGAIYNNNSDILNINNSTFKENKANKGGAIRNNAIIIISQSTFTNNTASEQGGTIYTEIGSINISNSSLNNNNASINGGTIYSYLGNIGISNSSLSNNNAESSSGGSIYIVYSTVSITNSSLENNTSPEQGGAIYNSRGTLYLFNSSFNKNKAGGNGGAIYNSGEVNVTGSNFTENRAKSGAAIYSDEDTKNTITGNIFTRNTADNNETLVVNGNKTISNNIYDSTDINIKSLNLTLGDEKTTYSPDEDVMLNLTIELEHPEYYDQDIQEKINKTIYINNIENDTTTLNHYALSDLELGKYDVYFTFFNLKSNNVTFLVTTDFETNVSNYRQLVEAIKNATSKGYCTYKINLLPGDYNATENIKWENSATRKIIINGNGNTLNGQGTYQFIQIANEHNLTLENILITNYWAINGGAIYNYRGNLIIHNSSLNNNTATRGGAIYSANGGNINITQSNLTHNTATNNGGAIYSSNGNVNISNSSLSNNKAETSSGGSIYVSYSTVSITNSSLENNTSPAHGGAIYNNNGNLSIFNSKLNKNTAEWNGGAIFNYKTSTNIEFNVTCSNFTENRASSAAAICSDNDGITNTITENTFTRNTANNNETLVVNGNKTISNNIYDSTDISFKTLNLTLEDEKIIYSPGDDVMLNFMIELEHPEYYDSDILEKGDINKTLYINNIENDTTTLDHYTLSNLEKGTYDAYFISSNQKSNNVTFLVSIYEVNVSNYQQLVDAIKNATNTEYNSYKINLLAGDYNATENITWKNSVTRKIIINGNGNTLNGQGIYQFIRIAQGHNLTLENITLTNYVAENGGAIINRGNLIIRNTLLNNNNATKFGGAIYSSGGNINISNSSLNNNKVEQSAGGAIHIFDSTASITNSTLENNTSPTNGGAIYNNNGNLYIINSAFNKNKAEWNGGAICNYRRSDNIEINIIGSNFTENQASSGATIYSDNEGITNTITGNIFTRNTANNNETLVINGNKTISNNIYDSTDISFKTINLTLQDEKTTFDPDEDIILNFTIELEHPEYYDSDILEKINKTLYINNIENDTTTNNSYILSNLERGEYNVYFTSCNLQSNEITIKVVSDSTISSPEQSYEYYAGVNNKIPLSINDPSEEKGIITTIVKDENGFKILSSYYNIGNSYVLSVDALIDGLKNIYSTLNDSYSINVTYTSNNDYVNPSSTNFTLNIIKQRNTTIVYNILNNTEENVKINITVLDSIYNTPILDAPIQITGDITQNTTAGIIADNTLTPGEYTINIKYQETDEYKESTATINFTVEIDKDKKIAELQEQVENLTKKLEEAQETIENLNNNITNLTQEIKQKDKQVEKLIEQINNLTTQLDEANDKINNLTTQRADAQKEIQTLTQENSNLKEQLEQANNQINNLTKQLEEAKEEIQTLNNIIKELTKPKLNTTITINPIKSSIGNMTKITANIIDENGEKVTGGKIIFKINGITLKDNAGNTLYADVKDGIASLNYKVQNGWIKNTTYIEAVYSGNHKYSEARTKATDILDISPGKTTITLDKTSISAKAGQTITLRAKVLDANGDRVNSDRVVFKLNGKTLKDEKGNTLYAQVIDGEAVLDYTIPATFTAGTYNLTAVFGGSYYQRSETGGTIILEKKGVTINSDKITTTDGKTTIKATITDETGELLVRSTKIAIKVNGITILNNATSNNGKIDVTFNTTFRPGMYELLIISAENGIYKSSKMTTVLKI